MKIKLPVKEPLVTVYKHHALPQAILAAQSPDRYHVLLQHYIQLFTSADVLSDLHCDIHWLEFCIHEYVTEMNPNPYLDVDIVVDRRTIKPEEMLDFLYANLQLGKYVYIFYDMYYLDHSMAYKQEHRHNNFLVTGYDPGAKTFSVYDYNYNDNHKLQEMTFSSAEICDAVNALEGPDWAYRVALIKPKQDDMQERVTSARFEQGIVDYYSRRNNFVAYEQMREHGHSVRSCQDQAVFGLDVYDVVAAYIPRVLDYEGPPSILPFHALLEHKAVLRHWLHTFIPNRAIYSERLAEVEKEALLLRNLALKYHLSGNVSIFNRLVPQVLQIKKVETELLENLLDYFQKPLWRDADETNPVRHY